MDLESDHEMDPEPDPELSKKKSDPAPDPEILFRLRHTEYIHTVPTVPFF
jgi:hypothetical protein